MVVKINGLCLGILASTVLIGVFSISCSGNHEASTKISSSLQLQISLRKEQLANPTPERLAQMQSMGMNTTNLGIQRIYIYLKQQLTQTRVNDLQSLGITIYPNSWIPPVNNQPTGFILADLSIDKLDALTGKDYVVRLDTAEKKFQTQSNLGK
jgi:hypothetical protein